MQTSFMPAVPNADYRQCIAFYGELDRRESHTLDNTHWARELRKLGYTVSRFDPDQPADITIHHNLSDKFLSFAFPETGYCVAVRTWDFGRFPPAWVAEINSRYDQFWAYSQWIADQAVASGIDPDRVKLVPLGADETIYHPAGKVHELPTHKRFRFLFVGGAVTRKGIDILLKAYQQAFTRLDDVSLVIKDLSSNIFYSEQTQQTRIQALSKNPECPEIIYLDQFLPADELAALYRACSVGVFPYRAEGFCKPILEAMASGLPSIVPNLGACLDFCSPETSFLVAAKRINLPIHKPFMVSLGFEEMVEEIDFPEVPVTALAAIMRQVYESSAEAIEQKAAAGIQIARQFTWKASAERIDQHLKALSQFAAPYRFRDHVGKS